MTPFEIHQRCEVCRYEHDAESESACVEAKHLMVEVRKVVAESESRARRHGHEPIPLEVTIRCPVFYAKHRRSA